MRVYARAIFPSPSLPSPPFFPFEQKKIIDFVLGVEKVVDEEPLSSFLPPSGRRSREAHFLSRVEILKGL